MAAHEVKWIKLSIWIFDDEKIRLIESLPDGETVLVVWLKLLVLAGRLNAGGSVFVTDRVPYTEENLAALFRVKPNLIKMALETFDKLGMIEIDDAQKISIRNWSKHQNVPGLDLIKRRQTDTARQRRHRSLVADSGGTGDNNVTVAPASHDENGSVTPASRDMPPPAPQDVTPVSRDESWNVTPVTPPREKREERREKRGDIPPPPLAVTPGGADEVLSYPEQQAILSEIATKSFTRPVRPADWSNQQKQVWLSEAQPITRSQMDALRWLYELPLEHRVLRATQRRQSLEKLLEFLCSEIDKAMTLQVEFGGSAVKKIPSVPEPELWRDAYLALWGEREDMPPSFYQLTVTQQRSVRKKIRELKGEPEE